MGCVFFVPYLRKGGLSHRSPLPLEGGGPKGRRLAFSLLPMEGGAPKGRRLALAVG